MALLPGGGYAEQVVVQAGHCLRVPETVDLVEAAALPEVLLTVFLNVFELAGLKSRDWVLVHGGGSGIGTAAIQLAAAADAKIAVTAGSPEKCARCLDLGADLAINYREEDFAEAIATATEGQGVSVILDSIGASYLTPNLASLAVGGRLVACRCRCPGGGASCPELRCCCASSSNARAAALCLWLFASNRPTSFSCG